MRMISEQIKELRNYERIFKGDRIDGNLSPIFGNAANTIEELSEKLKNGGWIPCSERLPEEKINPVTKDFYEYQVTFQSEDVTDVRHYKFGNGHWWNGPGIMDEYVTAWRESLEAYHGQVDN